MISYMKSIISLVVIGLPRQSDKKSKATMLISDTGISRMMIQVEQVDDNNLRDREYFKNNKANTAGNESRQQKSNVNWSYFQQNK